MPCPLSLYPDIIPYFSTWITKVPTFSFSMTVGLYAAQSVKRGALLLMSLISIMTTPRLLRLVLPPQQRPLSVDVMFSRYETLDFSSDPTSVMIPDFGSMLNGPSASRPPTAHHSSGEIDDYYRKLCILGCRLRLILKKILYRDIHEFPKNERILKEKVYLKVIKNRV